MPNIYGKIKHVPNHHPVLYFIGTNVKIHENPPLWQCLPVFIRRRGSWANLDAIISKGWQHHQAIELALPKPHTLTCWSLRNYPFFSEGLVMATCSLTSYPQGPRCTMGRLLGSARLGQLESAKWLVGVHQLGRHLLLPHLAEPWFHHKPQA